MRQVLIEQSNSLEVFGRLLQAHASLQRILNAELQAQHGLTVTDYGVLLRLARAPGERMRRTDLAEATALTASGITRLLGGLQAAGLVETAACESDRRVSYAVLTEAGRERLHVASPGHMASIRAVLGERYSDEELATLAGLLGRLPGVDASGQSCSADAPA
jgi:MarR family transcriptional regulator, 2-MHQ and catechol-resistance regulon repressor